MVSRGRSRSTVSVDLEVAESAGIDLFERRSLEEQKGEKVFIKNASSQDLPRRPLQFVRIEAGKAVVLASGARFQTITFAFFLLARMACSTAPLSPAGSSRSGGEVGHVAKSTSIDSGLGGQEVCGGKTDVVNE